MHTGDTEAREPLLTCDYLEPREPDSDEGRELCTSGTFTHPYFTAVFSFFGLLFALLNRHSELKNMLQ